MTERAKHRYAEPAWTGAEVAGKVYCAEHYEMSVFKRDAAKTKEMRA